MDFSGSGFEGPVDFGDRLNKIETISAINLTNSGFSGTFPCLKNNFHMEYIDIRQTKFSKIDTNNCSYNHFFKYFLASFNKQLTQNFGQIAQCFTNLTVLAFGVTNVWGDVPSHVTQYGGKYLALYDTDIATKYHEITIDNDNNKGVYNITNMTIKSPTWNQSWIIIGVTVSGHLPSFINPIEKQLKMILVPDHDFIIYAVMPIGCTFAALFVYIMYFSKYSDVINLSKYLQIKTFDNAQSLRNAQTHQDNQMQQRLVMTSIQDNYKYKKRLAKTFHQMMRSVHKFLWTLLLLLNAPLMVVYCLGSQWVSPGEGFQVLRISAAYLGSHEPTISTQIWVGIAFGLSIIYSWICAIFSISIIKSTKVMSQTICQFDIFDKHKRSYNYNYNDKKCDKSKRKNDKQQVIVNKQNSKDDNNDVDSYDAYDDNDSITGSLIAQEAEIEVKAGLGFKVCLFLLKSVVFIIFFIFFLLFLILPIGLYNLYHSLPSKNSLPLIGTMENEDNYQIISYIVENFTSFIISLQQWFLITPCVDILIALFPLNSGYQKANNHEQRQSYWYKNFMVQLFRNFTFIIIPLCCLFYFDDKCLQNWKTFWPSCDKSMNNTYALGSHHTKACQQIPSFSLGASSTVATVCFDICSTHIFYPRCARQIFQVLGPLYTIKATIGLIFPLIYHINTRFQVKNKILHVICYCFPCNCGRGKENWNVNSHSLDIAYIGLISSLEILIVFGWALPILIPIYNVIMIGYGLVYYYWLNVKSDKSYIINNGGYINIVARWLIVSIVIQQLLVLFFYSQTQSNHYFVAGMINMVCIGLYICIKLLALTKQKNLEQRP